MDPRPTYFLRFCCAANADADHHTDLELRMSGTYLQGDPKAIPPSAYYSSVDAVHEVDKPGQRR